MSISSLNNLPSGYLQSILSSAAVKGAGVSADPTLSNIDASSLTLQPDRGRISAFAKLMSRLQSLQQSDPAKYKEVTKEVAEKLGGAAQKAQTNGNSTAAGTLGQLATDFGDASTTGELPNIQDLAQAIGGMHHRARLFQTAFEGADADSDSSDSSIASGTADNTASASSQSLLQLLNAFRQNKIGDDSLNPASIITNSLSGAGINFAGGE